MTQLHVSQLSRIVTHPSMGHATDDYHWLPSPPLHPKSLHWNQYPGYFLMETVTSGLSKQKSVDLNVVLTVAPLHGLNLIYMYSPPFFFFLSGDVVLLTLASLLLHLTLCLLT